MLLLPDLTIFYKNWSQSLFCLLITSRKWRRLHFTDRLILFGGNNSNRQTEYYIRWIFDTTVEPLPPHNSKPLPTVIGFSCYFVPQNIETNSKAKLKCTKTILKLQFPASQSQIFFTFSPSTELAAAGGHVVVCELLLDALADVHKCFPQLSGDLTSW